MCGIFISYNYFPDKKNIKEIMTNRGPNDFSYLKKNNLFMAHSRLSITGNKGTQPFKHNYLNCYFMVNGEFYDYKNIKQKLNYQFNLDSDSEILAPLYEKFNIKNSLFTFLNGEFAFAIYDENEQKIHLARDRIGVKPLYYYHKEDVFIVASEIKQILPFVESDWNQTTLETVLTIQYHNSSETLFKNIKQVEPGTVLTYNIKKNTISFSKYWDFHFHENHHISFDDAKKETLILLKKSVQKRTDTNKKIAYTLSGGIDSAAILALGNKENAKAFSVSFEDGKHYDEILLAEKMATSYNVDFHPIFVNEKLLLDNMEQAIKHSENVSINSHVSAKYIMFKEIKKQGFNISLSGEGSDEIFGGYSHLISDIQTLHKKYNYLKGVHLPEKNHLDPSVFLEKMNYIPTFIKAKLSMGFKIHSLFKDNVILKHQHNMENLIKDYSFNTDNKLLKSSYLWIKICLMNYIINTLGDKLEMANSIEGRVPFLDKNILEFGFTLPNHYKIHNNKEKYILREALKEYIIPEIYDKPKHPFISPPLINWKNNSLFFEYLYNIFNSDFYKNHSILDYKKINNILLETKNSTKKDNSYDNVFMILISLYHINNLIREKHV